jgi:hypothetical protein
MHLPARQGHGDGFCGLYCLVNSLRNWQKLDSKAGWSRDAFGRLVTIADRLRLLDANHVINGFEDFELIEIFNSLAKNYRLDQVALPLEWVARLFPLASNISIVREIIDQGGCVIVSVENGEHWVLAHKNISDGKIAVTDPWPNSSRKLLGQVSTVQDGVVIVPRGSDIAKAI